MRCSIAVLLFLGLLLRPWELAREVRLHAPSHRKKCSGRSTLNIPWPIMISTLYQLSLTFTHEPICAVRWT